MATSSNRPPGRIPSPEWGNSVAQTARSDRGLRWPGRLIQLRRTNHPQRHVGAARSKYLPQEVNRSHL